MPKKGDKVYHRKDGLWEARYVKEIDTFGKKKYGSVYAKTCREAKEKRQNILDTMLLCQTPVGVRSITVARLVKEWLYLNRQRLKVSTYQRYEGFWTNHIEKTIGPQVAFHCGTLALYEFGMERLKTGLSPGSVNSILVFLHSCFKYGHRQYHLPMPDFMYFTTSRKEMRVFSREEQRCLERYLFDRMDIYKFGVLLTLYTGLRVGELCALQWEDIQPDSITVRKTMQRLRKEDGRGSEVVIGEPKTPTSARVIPIPSFLGEYVESFKEQGKEQTYFLGTSGQTIVEPRVMQYKFKQYLHDLGIEGATFHTLRHTFATRCVECGFELKSLSEVLGHSKIEIILNKYVHSSMNLKRKNMEKLKRLS